MAILERVAMGRPLLQILDELVTFVESGVDGVCGIDLLDDDGKRLMPVASRSLPPEYVEAIRGLEIGPDAGSSGTAAYRREAVFVEDLTIDPLWERYRHFVQPYGWRACWSTPIFAPDGTVLGTFAVYHDTPRGPLAEELARVDKATHVAAIALVRDRTQHELALRERQLRDSEERLRNIVEHTPNVAIQGYEADGTIVYCNDASLRIFGWQRADLIGTSLDEHTFFASHEDSERFRELRERAMTGETPPPAEYAFRRPDGTIGVVLSTVFRVPSRTGGWRLVCMDVELTALRAADAKRHELELQLHQMQRLHSLGTLASGVAHDFNNILAAVAANADLARKATTPEDVDLGIVEIQKATRRATELVRRILAFGRKTVPHREPVELRSVVEEAVGLVRASLPQRIKIETQFALERSVVSADTTQLHQVLLNTMTNAAHAIGMNSGTITIAIDHTAQVKDLPAGDYARLAVSDTGHGMDAATLAHVFDPFFTTKAPGEGTGLGLPIVRDIIAAHGGTVSLDSVVGRGTSVAVYLPLSG